MKLKISTLFHWLYATLMFLPILMFLPTCLYYAFNENAITDNSQVEIIDSVNVDFNQINNFTYRTLTVEGLTGIPTETEGIHFEGTNTNNGSRAQWFFTTTSYISVNPNHVYYLRPFFTGNEYSDMELWGGARLNQGYATYSKLPYRFNGFDEVGFYLQNFGQIHDYDFILYCNIFDLTQMFGAGNEPTNEKFDSLFTNGFYPYVESLNLTINVPTGNYVTISNNTNNINYAWQQVWDLPLFSWTHNSFVRVPFTYITGLFGLEENNSLNYVFTYFVSISICWLVFDLLMYVPNLAHRWLDRSALE